MDIVYEAIDCARHMHRRDRALIETKIGKIHRRVKSKERLQLAIHIHEYVEMETIKLIANFTHPGHPLDDWARTLVVVENLLSDRLDTISPTPEQIAAVLKGLRDN